MTCRANWIFIEDRIGDIAIIKRPDGSELNLRLDDFKGSVSWRNVFSEIVSALVEAEKLLDNLSEEVEELKLIIASDTGTESAVTAMQNQRDELLAALEKIASKCNLDMHGDDGSLGGYAYGIWNTANSAITRVKANTK